jgi:hypothetical protein
MTALSICLEWESLRTDQLRRTDSKIKRSTWMILTHWTVKKPEISGGKFPNYSDPSKRLGCAVCKGSDTPCRSTNARTDGKVRPMYVPRRRFAVITYNFLVYAIPIPYGVLSRPDSCACLNAVRGHENCRLFSAQTTRYRHSGGSCQLRQSHANSPSRQIHFCGLSTCRTR